MNQLQTWKKMYIIVYKLFLKFVYEASFIFKQHDNRKVVIALYRSRKLDGNLKYVYHELIRQLPQSKIHLVFSENKMNLKLFKEIITIANARYLILDDYYLPIYLIKPKKKLKVIQLWHAAGAFKKFGYSTIGTKFGPSNNYLKLVPIHSNYTHVYVSSKKVAEPYAEAFNMPLDRIFPLGIPRIDFFNDKKTCEIIKKNIYIDNPILKNKNVVKILIAPTYRAKGVQAESSIEITDIVIKMANLINNNIQIIFKAHPYIEEDSLNHLKEYSNILIADKYSINQWMLISDAFITDYSSSIFEFALLNRPMAHFIPDRNEYEHNRGFYQRIETVSDGVILKNTSQLLDWMNDRKNNEFFNSSRMINYNFDNTENVSESIVNHFISQ